MNDLTVSEDEDVTATTRELALKTATTVNTILFEIIIKKKKSQKKMERKTKQVRTDTTPPSGCVCAKQAKHRYRKSVFIWLHDARKKHVEALSDLSPPAAVLIRQHDGKKTHLRRTWRS